jgi:Tol biopolymer transport system component
MEPALPGPKLEFQFLWVPDAQRVALHLTDHTVEFRSLDNGESRTFEVPVSTYLHDWEPSGAYAVGTRQVKETGNDLIIWRRTGDSSTTSTLYGTPANEFLPRVSPDGHLVAYLSDQSGQPEVYLTTLPAAGRQVQISFDGADFGVGTLA